MKAIISILVLGALTLSAEPLTSVHAKEVLLEKLAAHQGKAERLYTVADGVLHVGDHSVDLTPVVESEVSAQGKNIVALRIEVAVDGARRPEATFGAIGIAANQEEATAVGLGEWYMGFALPFFQTLGEHRPAMAIAGYDVFVGALGLRGGTAQGWVDGSEAMNRIILNALSPVLSQQGDFVVLDLKVMVPATGRPKSECRVNGDVAAEVTAIMVALDWPRTTDGYIFKQAFVLKKMKPNQALEPFPRPREWPSEMIGGRKEYASSK